MKAVEFFLILLLASPMYSVSETQTDWSGGSGVQGPAASFGNTFLSDSLTDHLSCPGSLSISSVICHLLPCDHSQPEGISAGDIDNDGDMDILRIDDGLFWLENVNGTGEEWTAHPIPGAMPYYRSVLADMDSDGDLDLLNQTMVNALSWFENADGTGGAWVKHTISDTIEFKHPRVFASCDVNSDGITDVIAGSFTIVQASDGVACFRQTPAGNWILIHVDPSGYVLHVAASDMDLDGDADAVAAKVGQGIYFYENTDGAGGSWTKHFCDSSATFPNMFCIGDFSGDGYPDMASVDYVESRVFWIENTCSSGGGVWPAHTIETGFETGYIFSMASADLDSDGHMDIIAGGSNVRWWSNESGDGTQWTPHQVAGDFEEVREVSWCDMDTNGIPEVLACATPQNGFYWYELFAGGTSAVLESSVLDGGSGADWYHLDWNEDSPAGSEAGFLVRANDTVAALLLSPWSDTLWEPGSISGFLPGNGRYFQYKLILQAAPDLQSPMLEDVTVFWNPEGATESCQPVDRIQVVRNSGAFVFSNLPANAGITIHDMAGRTIATSAPTGDTFIWNTTGISRGIYIYSVLNHDNTLIHSGKLLNI